MFKQLQDNYIILETVTMKDVKGSLFIMQKSCLQKTFDLSVYSFLLNILFYIYFCNIQQMNNHSMTQT